MGKKFIVLAASFFAANLYSVLIAPFPRLPTLISQSDAIIILRVDQRLTAGTGPISFFLTVVVVVSVLNAYFPSIFRRP